jgi:hypothetical protein
LFGELENGGAVVVERAGDGVDVQVVKSGPAGLLQ